MAKLTAVDLWGTPSLGIPVVMTEEDIQVFGMKRSGVHPIAYWILGHFHRQTVLYKNCRVFDDRVSCRWFHQIWRNVSEPLDCRMMTFLDHPEEIIPNNHLSVVAKALPIPKIRVLVLRDPFNLFASRMQSKANGLIPNAEAWSNYLDTQLWKLYAKEFLRETEHLGKCLCINYNRWFLEIEYRKQLSSYFGDFTDEGLHDVPEPGSSFDFFAYKGQAQKQAVLRRWKYLWKNPLFQKLVMQDQELNDISQHIFGFRPPKQIMI